jgi:hypothetical protein
MMLGFPPFFQKKLPQSIKTEYPSSVKVATGLSIASFEALIINPLERLKVYLMTNQKQGNKITTFFRQHQGKLLPEMSRGLGALYLKQISSWVSFLVADEKVKKWERQNTGTQQLSFFSLMKVSFIVGGINTVANMPFDMLKTTLQKQNYVVNEGLFKTATRVIREHGIKGMYAGWPVRMSQYMIQSAFTVTVLEKLEFSWKSK